MRALVVARARPPRSARGRGSLAAGQEDAGSGGSSRWRASSSVGQGLRRAAARRRRSRARCGTTGAKTIRPSGPQLPPRGVGASQIVCGGPPRGIEPLELAVGEEAELGAVRRPERHLAAVGRRRAGAASPPSSSRSQRAPSGLRRRRPAKTIRRPSGESANVSPKRGARRRRRARRGALRGGSPVVERAGSQSVARRAAPRAPAAAASDPGQPRRCGGVPTTAAARTAPSPSVAGADRRAPPRAPARASPIACSRSRGFLRRQRRRRSRSAAGVVGGQRREIRRVLEHAGEDVRDGLAVEQAPAGQHLVEHDAERPDVGAPVDRAARRLLRAPCRPRCRGSRRAASPADASASASCSNVGERAASRPTSRRPPGPSPSPARSRAP